MKLNRRGSATVSLIGLVPFLLLALSILSVSLLVLMQWRQTHERCQTSLMKTQRTASEKLNELFGLNPLARQLRAEREAAEAAVKASPVLGPPGMAAANAYLASVITRQTTLRSRQELLKTKIKVEGNRNILNLARDLKSERGVDGWPMFTPLRLSIRQSPPNALTPDHDPSEDFAQKQVITGKWRLNPSTIIPDWISKLVPRLAIINANCAATLKLKGNTWTPTLGEGKH